MAERILNWGLLSTAAINRAVIPPLRMSARNRLVAVASRTDERAHAYAKEWDIARPFGSYESMLADSGIDAVYISLPNSLHMPWAVAAARAGKHVLCEKPLALNVREVDAISKAARENGVVVAEAFMYRHHPQTLRVRELLDDGAIGSVRQVHGAFGFYLGRDGDVRLDRELGGGSIWDVGCYPISYVRGALGVEPLKAFGWQVTGPSGVDVGFTGQLRFPQNVFFQFDCGFRHAGRQTMTFVGEQGILRVDDPFTPRDTAAIHWTDKDGKEEVIHLSAPDLYLGEVEDLYDAAVLGLPQRVSLADSRANTAAIIALLHSATSGRPQPIGVAD
jgi:predicted dehydrogenase